MCVSPCIQMCEHTHVKVRGQLLRDSSLLPPCESREFSHPKSSHWPSNFLRLASWSYTWLFYVFIWKHFKCFQENFMYDEMNIIRHLYPYCILLLAYSWNWSVWSIRLQMCVFFLVILSHLVHKTCLCGFQSLVICLDSNTQAMVPWNW